MNTEAFVNCVVMVAASVAAVEAMLFWAARKSLDLGIGQRPGNPVEQVYMHLAAKFSLDGEASELLPMYLGMGYAASALAYMVVVTFLDRAAYTEATEAVVVGILIGAGLAIARRLALVATIVFVPAKSSVATSPWAVATALFFG